MKKPAKPKSPVKGKMSYQDTKLPSKGAAKGGGMKKSCAYG